MIAILYAFNMKQTRSIMSARAKDELALRNAVAKAVKKGAQVISIRIY